MRPKHFVRCYKVAPDACCNSCHEDEELGYDSLHIENVEVAPGVEVGVYYCCTGAEYVKTRVENMVMRLGGSGRAS